MHVISDKEVREGKKKKKTTVFEFALKNRNQECSYGFEKLLSMQMS